MNTDSPKIKMIREIWLKAKKHKKASRLGLPAGMIKYEICECCDEAVHNESISIWGHSN